MPNGRKRNVHTMRRNMEIPWFHDRDYGGTVDWLAKYVNGEAIEH